MIVIRRIIRSKGSTSAKLVGGHKNLDTLEELLAWAKKQRKVFVFIDSHGNEGTIRSGVLMRTVDSHVRNIVTVGQAIQRPLPLDAEPLIVPEVVVTDGVIAA